MAEHLFRFVEKHDPARAVQRGKQHEQRNVKKPESLGQAGHPRERAWQLGERKRQDAGAHRCRKPVRRKLTDHFDRTAQLA